MSESDIADRKIWEGIPTAQVTPFAPVCYVQQSVRP